MARSSASYAPIYCSHLSQICEGRGEAILNARLESDPLFERVRRFILPGSQYQSTYALTMLHVVDALRDRYRLRVAFGRYRRLQVLLAIDTYGTRKWRQPGNAGALWNLLSPMERLVARALSSVIRRTRKRHPRFLAALRRRVEANGYIPSIEYVHRGDFSNVIEIFEALRAGRLATVR